MDEQLERYFRDKLTRLYEYGMKKQRDELAGNRTSGIRKLLSLDNTSVDLNVRVAGGVTQSGLIIQSEHRSGICKWTAGRGQWM